ncbi:hypothetical protein AVEN_233983-1 [Araneus ventricosus]|uniref:Uncharacterized protein n=1 Tax=Araneus ventricosus TaxID=182803 RepID=A0A4Y2UVZ7_ARAVE|nr:hypothetical protein AVEN_233983-1 [Araneus ventricosus]
MAELNFRPPGSSVSRGNQDENRNLFEDKYDRKNINDSRLHRCRVTPRSLTILKPDAHNFDVCPPPTVSVCINMHFANARLFDNCLQPPVLNNHWSFQYNFCTRIH